MPREFVFAKHYQLDQVTCSMGQDGAGKSTLSLAEFISIASGRNTLGEQPSVRRRVWLHNADDDSAELKRRIAAHCRRMDVAQSELKGFFHATGKDDFKIKVAVDGNGAVRAVNETVSALVGTIKDNGIEVCNFDPLIGMHSVMENDNNKLAEVAEQFGDISSMCSCATDLTHHARKPLNGIDDKEFTSDDSRGGGALRAAVRAMRVFNRMSKGEAEGAGLSPEDRGFYFRVDRGKANYLPPAVSSTWYKLENIALSNGDEVGTVVPWTYPGQGSAQAGIANERAEYIFMEILRRWERNGKRRASDRKGANYAPKLFAGEPEAKAAKLGKGALEGAMERLRDADRIHGQEEGSSGRLIYKLVVS